MLAALPFVARALDHVPDMRHHARLDETLPVLVEIDPPRIARAFGKHFEDMLSGMIPPNSGVYPLAFFLGRARSADKRRAKHTMTTVKPAIRSPRKGVQRLVRITRKIPPIEQHVRFAGGL